MKTVTTTKKITYLSIIIFSFLISFKIKTLINYPRIIPDKQQLKVSFSSSFLRVIGLGQERLLSSLLWIDTLIDADNEHYRGQDFGSWMYLRFKSIADLDPYFYENYLYGGLYLSVIKDDILGAKDIYDRGLAHYSHDMELLKNAAFHYRFELHDYAKALDLYEKASKLPDFPPYLKGVLARLKSHQNDPEGALEIVKAMYLEAQEGTILRNRLYEYYYSLRTEIDLACLNQGTSDECRTQDLEGVPYQRDREGRYQANKEIKEYKLYEGPKKRGD